MPVFKPTAQARAVYNPARVLTRDGLKGDYMKIVYPDKSEIILSDNGNTYIGIMANKIGHIIRRYNLTNADFIDKIVKESSIYKMGIIKIQ